MIYCFLVGRQGVETLPLQAAQNMEHSLVPWKPYHSDLIKGAPEAVFRFLIDGRVLPVNRCSGRDVPSTWIWFEYNSRVKIKEVFPYSLPSVGPGADPGVGLQAVSPQVTLSHPPGVTFHQTCGYIRSFHQMAPIVYTIAHIRLQLTAHLSTAKRWKAELAWLADL